MQQERDTRSSQLDDLEREVRLLQSRVRLLEGRLQDRAISISDTKGRIRRLRLGANDSLEVE